MNSTNTLKSVRMLVASPLILSGFLLIPNLAAADVAIACQASGGTNCVSGVDSIDDLNPPVVSTITVPQGSCAAGSVTDVNVDLNINHTWVGDISVNLSSPAGANMNVLLDRPGRPDGATSGFGCSRDNINATFDDASATPVEGVCAAADPTISGVVAPETALSIYNAGNADGVWTLSITDNAGGDSGELVDWSLNISCRDPAKNIPVFSFWGLFGLISLLGFGGRFITRRKK